MGAFIQEHNFFSHALYLAHDATLLRSTKEDILICILSSKTPVVPLHSRYRFIGCVFCAMYYIRWRLRGELDSTNPYPLGLHILVGAVDTQRHADSTVWWELDKMCSGHYGSTKEGPPSARYRVVVSKPSLRTWIQAKAVTGAGVGGNSREGGREWATRSVILCGGHTI